MAAHDPPSMPSWTTPADLRARLRKEWERGRLLAAGPGGEALYPWRIPLKVPASAELAADFDAARRWARQLMEAEKTPARPGYRLEYREIDHRQLGRNRLPVAAWLDTAADALALVGKQREAARFQQLATNIRTAFPALADWLARRPLRVLEHADDWPALLAVLGWIVAHPRPDVYLRQVDLPGVHGKFIESRRALLSDLLEFILPASAVDPTAPTGAAGFEQRYGFCGKPRLLRFRLLDGDHLGLRDLRGLRDLTVPADQFARLNPPLERVFVTENEVNFLAFPAVPSGLVVFGAGYGFDALAAAGWLREKALYYWGDIDSHGFAILDQLRGHFPEARSFLMDRDTLLAHQALWGREDQPTHRDLPHLDPEEAALYDDLRQDRLAPALRLEQERIGYGWLLAALARLPGAGGRY